MKKVISSLMMMVFSLIPISAFADSGGKVASSFVASAIEMAPIAIIVALVVLIGFPIIITLKYKFKSTPTANKYLENNSVVYHQRHDRFIREVTTKHKISKN